MRKSTNTVIYFWGRAQPGVTAESEQIKQKHNVYSQVEIWSNPKKIASRGFLTVSGTV